MRRYAASSIVFMSCGLLASGCPFDDSDDPLAPVDGGNVSVEGPNADGAGSGGDDDSSGSGGTGDDGPDSAGGSGHSEAGDSAGGTGDDSGHGGTGPIPNPDGGMNPIVVVPIAELPDAFGGAICQALLNCLGESKLRELTRREACDVAVSSQLRAKDFAFMAAAVAAGRVLYNPEQLQACLGGVRELGCDVLNHSFPQPCVDVLAGNVAIGAECAITAECEGTAFCTSGSQCPSTCAALLSESASCDAEGQCGDGLSCLSGSCTAPAGRADACGGSEGSQCALGLNCLGATETESGQCVPNSEVQVGDLDQSCEPGGTLCKDGLSCVFDGEGAFHCEGSVDSGAACHLGLPGQCPSDEYCNTTDVSTQSTCEQLPGDGEACVLNALCTPGTACISEGGNPVCRVIADNDGTCTGDAACRSGHCVSGHCEPPPACQ